MVNASDRQSVANLFDKIRAMIIKQESDKAMESLP